MLADGAPPSGTDKLYTGQRMQPGDAALGLYNYNARFYSTTLGAFVSADTVGDGLNRYAYVHDNPLRYTDPSGRCFTLPNGQRQSCTNSDAVRWFDCAMGVGCSGAVRWMAEVAINGTQYWGSVMALPDNHSGAVNAKLLSHFAVDQQSDISLWSSTPDTVWHYFGDAVHVSGEYFRASFYSLLTGDARAISHVTFPGMMGARPWWMSGTGLGSRDQDFQWGNELRDKFSSAAKAATLQASIERTLDVANGVGGPSYVDSHQLAWSDDQVAWIERGDSRYQHVPFPNDMGAPGGYFDTDMSCVFVGICPGPNAAIPDITY